MGVRLKILACDESLEDLSTWQQCEAFDCITSPSGSEGVIYDRIQKLWCDPSNVYVFGAKARTEQEFLVDPQFVTESLLMRVRELSCDAVPLYEFLLNREGQTIVGTYDF